MSDDYSYVGNAGPDDSSSNSNSIKFLVQQELAKLNTATLGKVVRAPYDVNGNAITPGSVAPVGFIDVQPLVNQLDGRGNAMPHGTVYRLSYHRYQSGAGAVIADPVIGDIGKVVIANRDTSGVRATNAQANPGSRRKFNMADGTFFGCTQAGAPGQYLNWTPTGFEIVDKNGNVMVGGPTGVTINGVLITLAGDVISKTGISLTTHEHSGVMSGGSDTGPPV